MRTDRYAAAAGRPVSHEDPAVLLPVKVKIVSRTPFGPVAVAWTGPPDAPAIIRILLTAPGRFAGIAARRLYPGSHAESCRKIDEVAANISAFLAGKEIAFGLDLVDIGACPAFQRSVLVAEHGIPRGCVSTYRRIAGRLGSPDAARAVGNALANNPFPIIVPCHRAIRSDGTIGGFQGGPVMKRKLLEIEGIAFDTRGRVTGARYCY